MDDLTLAEAINLKLNTFQDDDNLNFPPNFHSRTGHKLTNPPNMQSKLDEIQNYSDINDMKINTEKTKVMLFNKSTSIDFMPQLRLGSDEYLQVVEQMKLLGVTFTADLKWHKHVQNLSKAGFAKLWLLRRLKGTNAPRHVLIDIYIKQIRSVLEYAVPAWATSLTEEDCRHLERIQKCALSIIFGPIPYESAIAKSNLPTLKQRRSDLISKFALNSSKHPNFCGWYTKKSKTINTRNRKLYEIVPGRCNRWLNSPIPTFTRILNNMLLS